ncbi:zinc finger C3HC-type protein 1-like [Acipenser ruthenus]|uniref:zinc finger C3HC-type protein 1-like n=1 Tax=Acipenser ruthenus TaxID=7906 RepID=UPI002741876E|nr:zinc finger C3HC-type protein 1-like [Acipenser ruthenus]
MLFFLRGGRRKHCACRSKLKMAALSGRGDCIDNSGGKLNYPQLTPQKVRHLLNEGIATEDTGQDSEEQTASLETPNGLPQAPCETASKEAFFSRVETYTSLKWAGKPHELSPLKCSQYGWTNVECDMLKCSSCQAFLCALLQPTQDINKYKETLLGLQKALQTSHEKFCFWPDCPCPDRFWTIPINEQSVLFSGFLERYKSCCLLELQLPSMKPDDLINMSLTEDVISLLLQLIEDELKQEGGSPVKYNTEPLSVQVAACIVALCGWTCSPSLDSMSLPVITCSYCMRKVGLWGFQQIESICSEGDSSFGIASTPVSCHDGRGERLTPTPASPCRMVLRSQDTTLSHISEPSDLIPSPTVARTRSQEFHSPSPVDETTSPVLRGKRPVTRSMGHGEMVGVGSEVPSSPQRKAKRLRLCSSSSSDIMINRSFFDPIFQHRDWCPWVRMAGEQRVREQAAGSRDHPSQCGITENLQPAWKAVLEVFVLMKKSNNPEGGNSSESLHEKSKRVFKIFRRWQVSTSS